MKKKSISRGHFLRQSALAVSAFTIVPRHVLGGSGYIAPNDKLYIACIGCGGEAENDIHHFANAPRKNGVIAFLCDVDDRKAAPRRWTDRPVWPQGIPWPEQHPAPPKELRWDLWLGTAPYTGYIDNLVPFNWRGWWNFGTGALGDMGCHIIGLPFKLLGLRYPTAVTCSATTVYSGIFKEADFPQSIPPSSILRYTFPTKDGRTVKLFWMGRGPLSSSTARRSPTIRKEVLSDHASSTLNPTGGCVRIRAISGCKMKVKKALFILKK